MPAIYGHVALLSEKADTPPQRGNHATAGPKAEGETAVDQ
jgi:hypothetical protein